MPTPVPAELEAAIQSASLTFGVPQDTLRGVWVKESGATFPNPAVNSLGYGGLFGTKLWNASTVDQANYAASILAHLHSVYGDWRTALYHYSGGGYTTLPGGYDFLMALTDAEQQELLLTTRIIHEGLFGQDPAVRPTPLQDAVAAIQQEVGQLPAAIAGTAQASALALVAGNVDKLVSTLVQAPSSPVGQDVIVQDAGPQA